MNLQDVALGCLLGACSGDAAGATLEFLGRRPTHTEVESALNMTGGGVWQVAPGQITDDGELTLCLANALSALANFEIEPIARQYAAWIEPSPFDICIEQSEREARIIDGLAHLLDHLKVSAQQARAERRKLVRLPPGYPAEPSTRFLALSEVIHRYPLEAVQGEVPLEALINARLVATEMQPLVGSEPELDVNPNFENSFLMYISILDQQILHLRNEARRLMKGERALHAAAKQE